MKFLNKIFSKFIQNIGIDLGTASTLVYLKKQGIIINEPSVVAFNKKTNQILAIGEEAKKMVGKTPSHIIAARPLIAGVVSDFEVTEQMLRYFINKAIKGRPFSFFNRPRVVIGIPSDITEVETKAVEDAAKNAGAGEVYLVEEVMAGAIGAQLKVQEAEGVMVVDIGGGTSDIAVISLGGIVVSKSLKIAGDKLNDDIVRFLKEEYKLLIGERMAEDIKIKVGSAYELEEPIETVARGRDLISGLPKEIIISDKEIRFALEESLKILTDAIKSTIEETPPELVADIIKNGIVLIGGGSLLRNIDLLINKKTGILTRVADDPLTTVVRGTGAILEDFDKLSEVFVNLDLEKNSKDKINNE